MIVVLFRSSKPETNRATAFHQLHDASPKLRRVAPSCYLVLLSG